MYAVPVLGSDFNNVTVLSILDKDSANQLIDAEAQHIAVFPYLPQGSPNNAASYNYIKIRTSAGNIAVLGLAWINENSVEEVQARTITVTIANVSASDIPKVRNCLAQNGFNNVIVDIA